MGKLRGSTWLMVLLLGSLAPFNIGRAQAPDGSLTLELLQRIEQLEREVRYIRGELELYRHQVELLQQERAATRHSERPAPPVTATIPVAPTTEQPADEIDQSAEPDDLSTAVQPPTTDQKTPPANQPTSTAPGEAEQASFDTALGAFNEGRYPQAIAGFQQFLQTYPASLLASEAQYWLGESYFVVRDYDTAKESFINLGLRYPNSERLPDTLLKLSFIYEQQGDINRAKEILQKLLQVYPDTQAAESAKQRLPLLP